MYRHILVPTDGSPLSRAAVRDAVALAAALGARITGLFAAPAPTPILFRNRLPSGYATPKHNEQLIAKEAAKHLGAIEAAAAKAGVPCTCVSVKSDFPAEAILAAAKRQVRPDRDGLARPPRAEGPAARQRNPESAVAGGDPGARPPLGIRSEP